MKTTAELKAEAKNRTEREMGTSGYFKLDSNAAYSSRDVFCGIIWCHLVLYPWIWRWNDFFCFRVSAK